ncbi:MAG: hypothetical protein SGI86_07930 [Deltaproteobacteria bacterium]|nr:hypothetical protein [Deltaproteobacteria bacterium]
MTQDREQYLVAYANQAARRMTVAGNVLATRQATSGPLRGNVAPYAGCVDPDFHGTLASIWLWSRTHIAAGETRFGPQIGLAWGFVESQWETFIPRALSDAAGDEVPFDCAMVLRAGLATHALVGTGDWRRLGDVAARLLAGYLSDLSECNGRGFLDPGFLAWNLADYARVTGDRGLSASVGRFVDKAFGTRKPDPFADEASSRYELFDFSSTTATRILAVIATEGETPFVGTWLRERVAKLFPDGFSARTQDEYAWNACVAFAAGRAYLASTEDSFRRVHEQIVDELAATAVDLQGAIGRAPGFGSETLATFYYGLALDSMLRKPQITSLEEAIESSL